MFSYNIDVFITFKAVIDPNKYAPLSPKENLCIRKVEQKKNE